MTIGGRQTLGTSARLRWLLLGLIAFGLVGTGIDLILLEHYEDSWQLVPLCLVVTALVTIAGYVATRSAMMLRLLQIVMTLFLVAGAAGIALHYRGNLEMQQDMDPTATQWELFKKVMHAKAPPALAPAAMAQLGLLGLVFCYRHPAFGRESE